MSEKTNAVRMGLVGFGAWGEFHAQSIAMAPHAELVGIAAASEATCEKARGLYPEAAVTADFHELISRDDIEAVDIALPTHLHHEAASAALDAGKHVLLEKPMAPTMEQCADLVKKAEAKGLTFAIGHELRVAQLWGEARRAIEAGEIGEPQYILVELSRRPYRPGASGWRFDKDRVGSWILEEPIHFLDLARWYMGSIGEPERVYATASSKQDNPELKDNFSAVMHFPGGAYAVVTQTLSMFEHHQVVKVAGTEGSVWASWGGALDRTLEPTHSLRVGKVVAGQDVQDVRDIELPPTGEVFELREQLAMFAASLRGEGEIPATGRDGMWSVGMCLAAEESMRSGEVVSITDFMAPHL